MNLILVSKKRKGIVVKILLLLLVGYVGYNLVNQQLLIKSKKDTILALSEKLSVQEAKNEEIRKVLESVEESDQDYIEKVAHGDLGLARHGERIFMNSAGN